MEQNFLSEFACEMAVKVIKSENLFKSQFAADLKSLHSSEAIVDDCPDNLGEHTSYNI